MFYVWLGIIILLTIVELLTVQLTTIYFVLSGIVALFLSFQIKSFPIQFAVFILLGIILLVTTRSLLQKLLKRSTLDQQKEKIVGMEGIVIDLIKRNKLGAVKVDGKIWVASASKKIPVGSRVSIESVDGTTLRVNIQEEV